MSNMLSSLHEPDAAIRSTDSDAALARLSAVQKQYLTDPYIRHFVPRAHFQPPRPPLINVGTHARATAIDTLVDDFLQVEKAQKSGGCQIVSLGAGSDTRFWRIATSDLGASLSRYIEVDFPEVTTKKAMAIKKSKDLANVLGEPADIKIVNGGTSLHSPRYHLVAADLRQAPEETLQAALSVPVPGHEQAEPILSPHLPTLLLFECVLVYMLPDASNALVRWFVDYLHSGNPSSTWAPALGAIVYEMFGLQDPFGQVMLTNMKARNITLPGAVPYPTLASLPSRFLQHGFTSAQALTLRDIRRKYIKREEVERTSKLEMLDELEELELVLAHYAITWGIKVSQTSSDSRWLDWGLKPAPEERVEDY